ncbi:FMN-dependent NADH-azoreductase [Streptomyces asoensis]|uniref:FMN-dependent NADH-azoreductase n=1 Tax=Streptomyces asoensis TaxID=249586 RepID=A0ABQ3S5U1_9ACTN|nr:FMN-dependent NADH-azoreductase [Streptomyces asoensis]GHI63491.1 FMN-dependent NADH-azoreductase [Streptomyces asoensis]
MTRWRQNHPDGGYVYRDLAAEPIPHLTHPVREYLLDPSRDHGQTDEEKALVHTVASEVADADTILLGVPMYNYTIPSHVKAWIDLLVSPAHMVLPGADSGPLSGKSVIVVTARGGSYAPGTPREGQDHQEPYLRDVLKAIGLADNLTFVNAELTLAATVPALAELKPLGEKSLATAQETLRKLAA